jgi:hypothetical protein
MNIDNFFCKKPCGDYKHLCTKPLGHKGVCSSTAISRVIKKIDEKVGCKLQRDSYMTPGNSGAAKNRGNRCFSVQYTKQQIYDANDRKEVGVCIPKRYSSTPGDCFQINIDLATQIVAIKDLDVEVD